LALLTKDVVTFTLQIILG